MTRVATVEVDDAVAHVHIINLRQCSIFVDSDPIKRAMTDAADYIEKLTSKPPGDEVPF